MTEIFYFAVIMLWVALFMCVYHVHGIVREHAIENNLTAMVIIRSQAIACIGLVVLGGIATSGMHYVYTLHQLAVQ